MFSELNGTLTKLELRSYFKDRVDLFANNAALKAKAESRIVSQLIPFLNKFPGTLAGFCNLNDEPGLSGLFSSVSHSLVFPKVIGNEMSFLRVGRFSEIVWEKNSLGFKQPALGDIVTAKQIDVVLVPGLGFSRFGERLGRGKGFYDRYLNGFKGLKVGVCFDCQWTEDHLPTDDWDIKMNYIITENKCEEVKD